MKNKYLILWFIPIIVVAVVALFFLINGGTTSVENSVVMVKNSQLDIYCSGFVTNRKNIVTSYSAIVSSDGKTDGKTQVIFDGDSDVYDGSVIYSDEQKDIAIIGVENIPNYVKPIVINSGNIDGYLDVTVYGYDGTGKFMEGFTDGSLPKNEKYRGIINKTKIKNNVEVYTFDDEFDKAAQGDLLLTNMVV